MSQDYYSKESKAWRKRWDNRIKLFLIGWFLLTVQPACEIMNGTVKCL